MKALFLIFLVILCARRARPGKLLHRIIGGHEARPHSRPYMAFLKSSQGSCGGFLVAPDWVLTAGHCNGDITVILGAHDVHVLEDTQQVLTVESYHLHPGFIYGYVAFNDLLLLKPDMRWCLSPVNPSWVSPGWEIPGMSYPGIGLRILEVQYKPVMGTPKQLRAGQLEKLSRPAVLNSYVQPIALTQSSEDLPTGTPCSVAGWGLIDPEKSTNKLFETDIAIYSRKKCYAMYPVLDDGMICAGDPRQLRSPAQGDSGGPLVCNGKAEGIVSFGLTYPPSVFARIGFYLHWIKEIMG